MVLVILLMMVGGVVGQQAEPQPQDSLAPNRGVTSPRTQDCAVLSSEDCQDVIPPGQVANPQRPIQAPQEIRIPRLPNARPDPYQYPDGPANPSNRSTVSAPPQPRTEFEQMVADSAGRVLPLFGQSLFREVPSTFAATDRVQVPSDYTIGPSDELQIRIWGQVDADLRATVDRSGQIYVPRVGPITVAGTNYSELPALLRREISKIYKNFDLTVSIGRLRSIQVLVVGQARFPGTYTIGSLSTLVNALFACGGPSPQGSLRHIEVRREAKTVTDFDFYDLLIKGDKSKDIRLQPGDVIYIPHVGPLVAITGSVNVPAIYEAKQSPSVFDPHFGPLVATKGSMNVPVAQNESQSTSLIELIDIAGGLSAVADVTRVVIERIEDHQFRKLVEFPLDQQAKTFQVRDGDIIRVFSIVPRFENAVTLRGSVTNPGRFPWKAGMSIRDLLPSADHLLTRSYWLNRAAISDGSATEYPIAQAASIQGANSRARMVSESPNSSQLTKSALQIQLPQQVSGGQTSTPAIRRPISGEALTTDLRQYAPEINWHYATVQRVNPTDLSTKLLSFDLEKAILQGDPKDNLELQPGDIITVFSQMDIGIPMDLRSRYVILEGEVTRPGVYKVEPGETLPSLLRRAGGLTSNGYVYGIQLTRESARIEQQKSIDELVHTLEMQVGQSQSAAATSGTIDPQTLAARQMSQQSLIAQARSFQATGRVVINVEANANSIDALPNIQMEDNDKVIVPHEPSTVSVVGYVYNPGSFLFDPHSTAGHYLKLAGEARQQADMKHAFVLRANGTVVARTSVNGLFSGDQFSALRLHPGDQIVMPSKIETGTLVRGLRDWTQIASQLALTGAALAVIH